MRCPSCQHDNPDDAARCLRCASAIPARDPRLGTLIAGRFRVLALLGDGGMGRVYLAEQPMGKSSRKVAVKTLLAEHAGDQELLDRFQRECELVAQLEHPNIVNVYDFGSADDGALYIAMEFVEGETLAARIARGPIQPHAAMSILRQVCGALDEAHRRGILHRDLKPDNIMLTTRAGQDDFVKLLDFGIAKRSTTDPSGTQLTRAGAAVGTPAYMSPEQFRGKPLDARCDIYALGVVAFQMLNGVMPFEATTPWEWATHHMLTPPRSFDASPLGAHVPVPVRRAIQRALSKEPSERQGSAGAFLAELTGSNQGDIAPAVMGPAASMPPNAASAHAVSGLAPTTPIGAMSYPTPAAAPSPHAAQPYAPMPAPRGYGAPTAPAPGGHYGAAPAPPRAAGANPLLIAVLVLGGVFMLMLATCTLAVFGSMDSTEGATFEGE